MIEEKIKKHPKVRIINCQNSLNHVIESYQYLETVRCSNLLFLNDLLHEIKTQKESYAEQCGIPINQLGLSVIESFFIYLIKKNRFLRSLFSQFLSAAIAKKIVKTSIINSGAFYFIQSVENSPKSLIDLGKCFQEIWVSVNSMNYSFQPICNSLIFWSFNTNLRADIFSTQDRHRLVKAHRILVDRLSVDLKQITLGFRVGIATKESGRAPRKNLSSKQI